ncbi:MAG: hypothetical protein E7404_08850 [Ruminococcaceae bacterium]|nr:hypothetical protein [Oscillospiraceae bacterium]
MNMQYKFMRSKHFLIGNKQLLFILFMVVVLVLSFVLSYFLVSSSQKNESEKIGELSNRIEHLNEEIRQKDLLIAELNEKLEAIK